MNCSIQKDLFGNIKRVVTERGEPSMLYAQSATQIVFENSTDALLPIAFQQFWKAKISTSPEHRFETGEPKLFYKIPDGVTSSYKTALSQSGGNPIEIGFVGKKGFLPLKQINSSLNDNSALSIINNAILNNKLRESKVFNGVDFSITGEGISRPERSANENNVFTELNNLEDNSLELHPRGGIFQPIELTLPENNTESNLASLLKGKQQTTEGKGDPSISNKFDSEGNPIQFSKGPATLTEVRELFQPIVDRLKSNGLSNSVYQMTSQEIDDKLKEIGVVDLNQKELDKKGISLTPNGFVHNNDVYLNTDTMGLDTPIHEFGHLWNSYTKENNPELFNRGLKLVETEGQEYIDHVKATQPDLVGEALLEEALAQAIGDNGARIIKDKSNLKNWIQELFDWIAGELGISDYVNQGNVQDLTLEQFSTAVAIELLKNKPVGEIVHKNEYGDENVAIEVNYIEESKKKELILAGKLKVEKNIDFIQGLNIVSHGPDNMFTGEMTIHNKQSGKSKSIEGNGGVYFVTKFGDVWSTGAATSQGSLIKAINEQLEKNIREGKGSKTYLALSSAAPEKLKSNTQGVRAITALMESIMDAGHISNGDYMQSFIEGLDEFNRKAENAARKKGKEYKKDDFVFPEDLAPSEYGDFISKYFEDPTKSTFEMRGNLVEDILQKISAKPSFKNNVGKIREFLRLPPGKSLSGKDFKRTISDLAVEQMLQGVDPYHIYALVEITAPVFPKETGHGAYPFSIGMGSAENLLTPKLIILENPEHASDVINPAKSGQEGYISYDNSTLGKDKFANSNILGGNRQINKGEVKVRETRFSKTNSDSSPLGSSTLSTEGPQILPGAPTPIGASGADLGLTTVAKNYAKDMGIEYKRQNEYVTVNEDLAKRISQAYEDMLHEPQNPVVKEAYQNLIKQTTKQYEYLVDAGYKFYFYNSENDPYNGNPVNAMRDLRNNKTMAVYATSDGYGTNEQDVNDNPMLEDTGLEWHMGGLDGPRQKVLANDLFRAVHDAFGHGLEGAGFRARGEENAWQAHARLFTGSALAALTTETRGQNSWLNFGPYGESNRTASVEDTIFADQKIGLMPEWTWKEGFNEGGFENNNGTNNKVVRNPFKSVEELKDLIANKTWGILTGENPNAIQYSEVENFKLNQEAKVWLRQKGYNPISVIGKYDNIENSFLIPSLTQEDALEFAKTFGQESVITDKGLIYQDGRIQERDESLDSFGGEYENYFTSINIGGETVDFTLGLKDFDSSSDIDNTNSTEGTKNNFVPDIIKSQVIENLKQNEDVESSC